MTSHPAARHGRPSTSAAAALLVAALLAVPVATSPAAAGDEGRLVYASNAHQPGGDVDAIVSIGADGAQPQLMLQAGTVVAHPSWSPDGQQIAYETQDGGIWVAAADGSGARRVTDGAHPAWSPDGAMLAFHRPDQELDAIFRINLDGSGLARVSPPPTTAPTAQQPEGGDTARYLAPTWSPDGTRIAANRQFCTFNFAQGFGCTYRPQLAVIDVATAAVTVLHEVVQGEEEGGAQSDHIGGPDWSPDGSRIAFHRRVVEDLGGTYFRTFDLFTISATGGSPTNITQTGDLEAETDPSWSPDGTRIAYTHSPGGSSNDEEIFVIPADGGTPRNVTNAPGPSHLEYVADRHPDWQPTGGGTTPPPPPPPTTPPPPPPGEPVQPVQPVTFDGDPATTERLSTADPTTAAIAISQARFPGGGGASTTAATHVVLSRDDAFPDSLTGSALTGFGPLLFTGSDALTPATRAEVDRVLQPPATVYLLGGDSAISPDVEAELAAAGYRTSRLSGPSRVETALAVADEVRRIYADPLPRVFVARASGVEGNETSGWADSVSAGGLAAWSGIPILITPTSSLHPAVEAWLAQHPAELAYLLGGPAALSAEVEADIPNAVRVSGAERTATAAAIATELWPEAADDAYVVINGGHDLGWAFGLAAAGLSRDATAPVLLVGASTISDPTAALVSSCGAPQVDTLIVGNTSIVGTDVEQALDQLDGQAC